MLLGLDLSIMFLISSKYFIFYRVGAFPLPPILDSHLSPMNQQAFIMWTFLWIQLRYFVFRSFYSLQCLTYSLAVIG
jgi:hypothetical protein